MIAWIHHNSESAILKPDTAGFFFVPAHVFLQSRVFCFYKKAKSEYLINYGVFDVNDVLTLLHFR